MFVTSGCVQCRLNKNNGTLNTRRYTYDCEKVQLMLYIIYKDNKGNNVG